jgi:hypothetical protein
LPPHIAAEVRALLGPCVSDAVRAAGIELITHSDL